MTYLYLACLILAAWGVALGLCRVGGKAERDTERLLRLKERKEGER